MGLTALHRVALLSAMGALGVIAGCKRTSPTPAGLAPTPLKFQAVGCSFVERGGVMTCELTRSAKLRIAIDDAHGKGELRATLEGRALTTTPLAPTT